MAQNNWEQVKDIFAAALRQKEEEREQFLEKACKDDKNIRREVDSLLSSDDSAGSFMESPADVEFTYPPSKENPNFSKGQEIKHYKIIEQIGKGGMGEIYLAHDTKLRRNVALKLLPAEFTNKREFIERFEREALAVSGLNHPNILTVHEFGKFENTSFITTEFIEGITLRDHLKKSPLELKEVLDIAIQMTSALITAHKAGIIHRDIKPENVMIREDGIVKLLDFGLAKPLDLKTLEINKEDDIKLQVNTQSGVIMGTPQYMSPEQVRGKPVNERTDIWSLGVVFYEMITGTSPFHEETHGDTFAAILKTEPAPFPENTSEAFDAFEEFVNKCLKKKLQKRYQTSKDLLFDLEELNQNLEFEAKLEQSVQPNLVRFNENEARKTAIINEQDSVEQIATTVEQRNISSAEYITNGIKNYKYKTLTILATVIIASAALSYFTYLAPHPPITSIAVLPFVNGNNDANLDYLSDGLSESVIDRLSQLPQLKVIARSSSFKYRGENIDLQDVANKLGVQAIVTGVVTQRGDNLIVRVELIDTRENVQLWSEHFNRKTTDALTVQQEIAQMIAGKLHLKLSGAQNEQLVKNGTDNMQAFELLLKGDSVKGKDKRERYAKVLEYYKQAIALDPNYALAYARLARIYRYYAGDSILDPKDMLPKAQAAAQKAVELDPNLPDAHLQLAGLATHNWHWQTAEREFQRTLELNPNSFEARHGYALYLSNMGRSDQAVAESYRARELDPQNLRSYASVIITLAAARRFDEAIVEIKKVHDINPNYLLHILGKSYVGKGMYREAIDIFQQRKRLLGNLASYDKMYLGMAYAGAGEREKARAILKELEKSKEYVSPGELPILYAALGEREKAFALLEKAYAAHDLQLQNLKVELGFDPLHDDPRFQDLLRRVGLPQ